jgi:hypothetical protein
VKGFKFFIQGNIFEFDIRRDAACHWHAIVLKMPEMQTHYSDSEEWHLRPYLDESSKLLEVCWDASDWFSVGKPAFKRVLKAWAKGYLSYLRTGKFVAEA